MISNVEPTNLGYKLSKTIASIDLSPVKCLTFLEQSSKLLLGSEGGILTCHDFNTDTPTYANICHPYSITSLVSSPTHDSCVVGSREGYVRLLSKSNECSLVFLAHDKSVVSLNWLAKDCLVSSSWDGTAKIWDISTTSSSQHHIQQQVLAGHENATCSIVLPNTSQVLTGSAGKHENNQIIDYKLRLWDAKTGELLQTIPHCHTSSIRALVSSDHWLASCANDGSVQLYDVATIQPIQSFHTNASALLLNVTSIQNGKYVATCAEDGHVFIWNVRTGEKQVLQHPGCVWSILGLPNGDFVTACQDGKARLFTTSPERFASEELLKEFEVENRSYHSKSGLSQEELDKLPIWETDQYKLKGKKEGHVQLFRKQNTNKAIATQWSADSQSWIEVGEVTATGGGDNSSSGGAINGVSFDYVFPIEVDMTGGGVRTLQIGYNVGDNPFVVAQKFIDEHELQQYYLQQIADYIRERVSGQGGVQLGSASAGTSDVQMADVSTPTPNFKHLPLKGYTQFDAGVEALDKITKKILEFQSTKYPSTSINSDHVQHLVQTLKNTSRYHSSKILDLELNCWLPCIESWNIKDIFPIVDLLRLMVLHPDACSTLRSSKFWEKVFSIILQKWIVIRSMDNFVNDKILVGFILLSLRLFCNAFRYVSSTSLSLHLDEMVQQIGNFISLQIPGNNAKHVRMAIVSLLGNISVFLKNNGSKVNNINKVLVKVGSKCHDIINSQAMYEKESITRLCLVLGSIGVLNKNVWNELKASSWISDIKASSDASFNEIVKELKML